jgi:hypothetical protein
MSVSLVLPLFLLLSQNGQVPASPLPFDALRAAVTSSAAANGSQELTVNWNVDTTVGAAPGQNAPAPIPANRFEIAERHVSGGPPARERNPELSPYHLVVVGTDAAGTPLSWSLVADPRIVRAEQPGPDGVLTGAVLYRPQTQFTVTVPDTPQVTQITIYQPRWTGATWVLDPLGSFPIPRS